MADLRQDLFERVRQMVHDKNKYHPWLEMDNKEVFKAIIPFPSDRLVSIGKG
jgi:hypothetical protein